MNRAHFTGIGIIQEKKRKKNSIWDWSVNVEAGKQLSNDDRLWVDKWLIVTQNSHSCTNSVQTLNERWASIREASITSVIQIINCARKYCIGMAERH